MRILLLLSLGMNAMFIRSYVRSCARRERRRLREEHERYRLAFMENLRRIRADWMPGFPKALTAGAGSSGDKNGGQ